MKISVSFEVENLNPSQAEKEEIERLQKELHSTKLQLDDLKFQQTQGNTTEFLMQNEFESTPPFVQPEFPPAEMEMIRATVIHENKHKHNLDRLASLEDEIEKVITNRLTQILVKFMPIPYFGIQGVGDYKNSKVGAYNTHQSLA